MGRPLLVEVQGEHRPLPTPQRHAAAAAARRRHPQAPARQLLSCAPTQTRIALAAVAWCLVACACALGLSGLWLHSGGPLGRAASRALALTAATVLGVMTLALAWWLSTVRRTAHDREHLLRSNWTRHLYGTFGDSPASSAGPSVEVQAHEDDSDSELDATAYCVNLAAFCGCPGSQRDGGSRDLEAAASDTGHAPLLREGPRAAEDTVTRVRATAAALRRAAQQGEIDEVRRLLSQLAQEPMTLDLLQQTGVGVLVNFLQGPVEEPAQRLVEEWRKLAAPAATSAPAAVSRLPDDASLRHEQRSADGAASDSVEQIRRLANVRQRLEVVGRQGDLDGVLRILRVLGREAWQPEALLQSGMAKVLSRLCGPAQASAEAILLAAGLQPRRRTASGRSLASTISVPHAHAVRSDQAATRAVPEHASSDPPHQAAGRTASGDSVA